MKRKIPITILTLMMILAIGADAQNLLNKPESIVFDTLNNRYLVANVGDGSIIQIENDFVTQSYFKENLGEVCVGSLIADDIYYVTVNRQYVRGFDLATDELVSSLYISSAGSLQGMAVDTSGYLYIVDSQLRFIYRHQIGTNTVSIFVADLAVSPQDIAFDKKNNRLLLCTYAPQSIIQQISLPIGTISQVTGTSMGLFDGIAIDHNGGVYVSSHHSLGGVYHFEPSFIYAPDTIVFNFREPTNPDFNFRDNILAVPSFSEDRVIFIPLLDSDDDGYIDINDNCPTLSNPDQESVDNDRIGDVCDNCPEHYNNDQSDSDDDGVGDACDNCEGIYNAGQEDPDEDGIGSICDNCPNHYNPWQEDHDGDGIGTICDFVCGDFDGDEVVNILDVVYLINGLYKDGPTPQPPDRMDANHDALVNILDVVYLLNKLYKEGPEPDCTA